MVLMVCGTTGDVIVVVVAWNIAYSPGVVFGMVAGCRNTGENNSTIFAAVDEFLEIKVKQFHCQTGVSLVGKSAIN